MASNLDLDRLHAEWKSARGKRKKESVLRELKPQLSAVAHAVIWHDKKNIVAGTDRSLEMVQAAVSEAIEDMPGFRGVSKKGKPVRFSTWFFRVVKNTCYRALRQKIQRAEVPLSNQTERTNESTYFDPRKPAEDFTPSNTFPHEYKEYEDSSAALEARLTLDWLSRGLSVPEKELLRLKMEGFTYEEISEWYGNELSSKGAEARFNRLRKKLVSKAQGSSPLEQ